MLSAQTLERVSCAYRRGYYDGHAGEVPFCEVKPEYIKPFAHGDYEKGYAAGTNDRLWTDRYAARVNTNRAAAQG